MRYCKTVFRTQRGKKSNSCNGTECTCCCRHEYNNYNEDFFFLLQLAAVEEHGDFMNSSASVKKAARDV